VTLKLAVCEVSRTLPSLSTWRSLVPVLVTAAFNFRSSTLSTEEGAESETLREGFAKALEATRPRTPARGRSMAGRSEEEGTTCSDTDDDETDEDRLAKDKE